MLTEKRTDSLLSTEDAENNTVVALADSNDVSDDLADSLFLYVIRISPAWLKVCHLGMEYALNEHFIH